MLREFCGRETLRNRFRARSRLGRRNAQESFSGISLGGAFLGAVLTSGKRSRFYFQEFLWAPAGLHGHLMDSGRDRSKLRRPVLGLVAFDEQKHCLQ